MCYGAAVVLKRETGMLSRQSDGARMRREGEIQEMQASPLPLPPVRVHGR